MLSVSPRQVNIVAVRPRIAVCVVASGAAAPHGRSPVSQGLFEAGIGYTHMCGLGGLRRRKPDPPNTGWKNASF